MGEKETASDLSTDGGSEARASNLNLSKSNVNREAGSEGGEEEAGPPGRGPAARGSLNSSRSNVSRQRAEPGPKATANEAATASGDGADSRTGSDTAMNSIRNMK